MVLSGMDSIEQMEGNISCMKNFQPLNKVGQNAVKKVQEIFHFIHLIPCTACRYCTAGCPQKISIPDLFAVMNSKQIYHDRNSNYYYNKVHTKQGGKASDCIKCDKCGKPYPQHLSTRDLLADIVKEFEKRAQKGDLQMAKLIVFYSRADENYLSGVYRYIAVATQRELRI